MYVCALGGDIWNFGLQIQSGCFVDNSVGGWLGGRGRGRDRSALGGPGRVAGQEGVNWEGGGEEEGNLYGNG